MADPQETIETAEGENGPAAKTPRPGRVEPRRTVETGQVKQLFPHGRTKTVQVEVKRKRSIAPGGPSVAARPQPTLPTFKKPSPPAPTPSPAPTVTHEPGVGLRPEELALRIKALEQARKDAEIAARENERREAEEALRLAREAAQAALEAQRKLREETEKKRKVTDEERRITGEEARRVGEDSARHAAEAERRRMEQTLRPPVVADETEEAPRPARGGRAKTGAAPKSVARPKGEPERRRGRLTISEALSDSEGRMRSVAAFRRRMEKERRAKTLQPGQPAQKVLREVVIPEAITVGELANRMAERSTEVIKALMKSGVMATINQTIDPDTAELIVTEFGHRARRVAAADVEKGLAGHKDTGDPDALPRPPVVTIMGHVDHGKTSLLDALRQTDVAAHEAGGITQHIGAYQVETAGGKRITFLDTPGHEAFTAMRKRGAQVTDIVVLVVAADDGVQPQTVEAINHARAARVPMIVAINKIDKPDANPTRVMNDLLKYEVVVEDMGGDTQCVPVSALKKTGLDKLEAALLLQAEILELKANPARDAAGTVIEAKLDRGRGPVATVLVQRGTLKVGDIFVAGAKWGRVRALSNHRGEAVNEAPPSTPVEVQGLTGTPLAGDDFIVVADEARAREVTEFRESQQRDKRVAAGTRGTLEQMFTRLKEGGAAEVPVVIKADVQGSAEAIAAALEQLGTAEVKVRVLHAAVGSITESDVSLAGASGGLIVGFNVRANPQSRDLAKQDNVEIRYYSIIYDIVEDVKAMMSGKLRPTLEEQALGTAEVREVFTVSKVGRIAGCKVTKGVIRRSGRVRLMRDGAVVHEGTIGSLKHFKDDVREVREGFECGIGLDNYNDIHQGDTIECFEIKQIERKL